MKLVPIADNILVNVDHIGAIEQRVIRSEVVMFIFVDGKEYEYMYKDRCPIEEFLDIVSQHSSSDRFAG